jgi:hypothetical protein
MTAAINGVLLTPSLIELSFAWTPEHTYTYTAPNGQVITAPSAAVNTMLTFTATTRISNQGNDITGNLTIIEYRWDFGDGVVGYGNPVGHTYKITNFQAQAALRVTDSKGRQWFTRAQLYLDVPISGTASFPLLLNRVP